jgi:hypothetical protein
MNGITSKAHPLLYVILSLCVLNIVITGVLFWRINKPKNLVIAPSGNSPLPKGLQSDEERKSLFEKIKNLYNSNDVDGLYQMIDPAFRMETTTDKIHNNLSGVKQFSGKILEGAYSYYEIVGNTQGINAFRLYYPIKTEKGKGVMTVAVGQQGDGPYRFIGFNINMTE